MRAANIHRSHRLQAVLVVLMDYKRHTTRDLIRQSGMCAINSIVSELRANGIHIICQREGNKWFYELAVE